jgi:hypothetical protein
MTSGRIGGELVVLSIFCVLTIFFFPVVQGPYPAVNGPVTALQAARAAARLRLAIVQSALSSLGNVPVLSLALLFRLGSRTPEDKPFRLSECDSVLRC